MEYELNDEHINGEGDEENLNIIKEGEGENKGEDSKSEEVYISIR